MSSLWSKITHFVHGAAVKVSAVFVKVFGQEAAHQFAQGALAVLKTDAGKLALDAVESVESLALDASGKRAAAFSKLASDAKTQGLDVADNVLNLLIETAVAFLKGHIAAA
jgi:hypothetical protein